MINPIQSTENKRQIKRTRNTLPGYRRIMRLFFTLFCLPFSAPAAFSQSEQNAQTKENDAEQQALAEQRYREHLSQLVEAETKRRADFLPIRQALTTAHAQQQIPEHADDLCRRAHTYCTTFPDLHPIRDDDIAANDILNYAQSSCTQSVCLDLKNICTNLSHPGDIRSRLNDLGKQIYIALTCHQPPKTETSPYPMDDKDIENIHHFAATLGFYAELNRDHYHIVPNGDVLQALKTHAALSDEPLRVVLALFLKLREVSGVSQSEVLEDELHALFRETTSLSEAKKLAIYYAILPDLMKHAHDSGAQTTMRNLNEIAHSLRRNRLSTNMSIVCSQLIGDRMYSLQFDASNLSNHRSPAQLYRYTICAPDEMPDNRLLTNTDAQVTCQSSFQPIIEDNRALLHAGLSQALVALSVKDHTAISSSLATVTQALGALHGARLSEDEMCQISTIYMISFEQDRFAELDRLDQALRMFYPQASFYDHILRFRTCQTAVFDRDSNAVAQRLWTENQEKYEWIIRNFHPKERKNLSKNFKRWTKSKRSKMNLPRRLIASWTLWSMGDYARAAAFAGDIAKGKSTIAHPQLNSYALMLKIAQGEPLSEPFFSHYVRAMMLKNAPLAYQTMTAAARLLPQSPDAQRTMIADVFRTYPASNAPYDAALFFEAYEDELKKPLDEQQRADIDIWLDTELARSLPSCELTRRRLKSIETWSKNGNETLIYELSLRALSENPAPFVRELWEQIRILSENLIHQRNDINSMPKTYEYYETCMMPFKNDIKNALTHVSECWTRQSNHAQRMAKP